MFQAKVPESAGPLPANRHRTGSTFAQVHLWWHTSNAVTASILVIQATDEVSRVCSSRSCRDHRDSAKYFSTHSERIATASFTASCKDWSCQPCHQSSHFRLPGESSRWLKRSAKTQHGTTAKRRFSAKATSTIASVAFKATHLGSSASKHRHLDSPSYYDATQMWL